MFMSEAHAVAYRGVHERVKALIEAADPAALEQPAPATPEWTVREILCHLVGVTDDIVNGRLDGIASDGWTAAQVDKRCHASAADLLAEWDKWSPQFEEMLTAAPPEIAGQALFDAATHEHDMRHALGEPGARDSDAIDLAWEWIMIVRPLSGAPGLRFVTEAGTDEVGDAPVATIETTRFELLRATTGRRSAEEVAAYGWDPEPQPELLLASADIFTLRPSPLNE
jgi:uncharacterized protein (TIGR03083 family)